MHRSELIRVQAVTSVAGNTEVLTEGQSVTVSRRRLAELRRALRSTRES